MEIHGWLFVYKPTGWLSTKVVSIVKKQFPKSKVGHGGTLDPMAEGVLPIALGEATKTVDYVLNADKTYLFTIGHLYYLSFFRFRRIHSRRSFSPSPAISLRRTRTGVPANMKIMTMMMAAAANRLCRSPFRTWRMKWRRNGLCPSRCQYPPRSRHR